eukprot:scaffold261632_cov20-Prasinocladus_malaysianus.AAC.1
MSCCVLSDHLGAMIRGNLLILCKLAAPDPEQTAADMARSTIDAIWQVAWPARTTILTDQAYNASCKPQALPDM